MTKTSPGYPPDDQTERRKCKPVLQPWPKMPYNTCPKKDYIKLVVIHPHSYMARWLVRALGADPLRIPITR